MSDDSKAGCVLGAIIVAFFGVFIGFLLVMGSPVTIKQSVIDGAVERTDISRYKSYVAIPVNNEQQGSDKSPVAVIVASNETGKAFDDIKSQVTNELVADANSNDKHSIMLQSGANYQLYTVCYESKFLNAHQPASCSIKQVKVVTDTMDLDGTSGIGQSINGLKTVKSTGELKIWIGTRIKQDYDEAQS